VLYLNALLFRTLQTIFTLGDLYLSRPVPQQISFSRKITSTTSPIPGSIELLFYTPLPYRNASSNKSGSVSAASNPKYPLLINFHGGGFTIGHAGDDARWATAVISRRNAVVVSVNYRLAPKYPFPIGIEDCVSAVLWL